MTIIIPVYNTKDYLDECVRSVLGQSYTNLEILLVDDGSTDCSGKMCDDFAAEDSRVRVIHRQNGGLSAARNTGIDAATSDYLIFLDGDDYLTPIAVEQLIATIADNACPIGVCTFAMEESALSPALVDRVFTCSSSEAIREMYTEKTFFTTAGSKIFRKKLFDNIKFPQGLLYEDFAVMYRLFDAAKTVAFADAKIYYYRYTPTGITKSSFKKKHMDYFTVTDEVTAYIAEYHPERLSLVNDRTVRNAISFYRKMSESGYDDKEDLSRVRGYVKKHYWHYLRQPYSFFSKTYGLLILLAPRLAHLLFRR